MNDLYIGIDPGSKNCALVVWSPTRGLVAVWKPKGTMPKGVLRLHKLMHDIGQEFGKLARDDLQGRIGMVAMEAYSMAEKYGQHASGEVGGAIKLAVLGQFDLQDRRAYPILVAPQQLKKFATGNGNTKKEMLPKEVLKRWAMDFDDTNVAEAYVLARIAHAVDVRPEMTQFQRDVVAALDGRTEYDPTFVTRRLVRVGK
jgi:crossover junction endodeoxyribonuclease RuvC